MKTWHRGSGLIAFLPKLTLAAMILGAAAASTGDGGFIHRDLLGKSGPAAIAEEEPEVCTGGTLAPGDGTKDLEIVGACKAGAGLYQYKDVNIFEAKGSTVGGSLTFEDTGPINFWAKSIIIENHGALIAGSPSTPFTNALTIHLWGKQQNEGDEKYNAYGVPCRSPEDTGMDFSTCGIPKSVWDTGVANYDKGQSDPTAACTTSTMPGGYDDCFYQYQPLPFDGADKHAFFGYKVLAVSYGGTLNLYGAKGATYSALDPSSTGTSWTRLDASLKGGESTIVVADPTGQIKDQWVKGDQIVVGSTDYLPGHAELLTITNALTTDATNKADTDIPVSPNIEWPHNGTMYSLTTKTGISRLNLGFSSIDTRAPVALLTRNIRIVSDDALGATDWPAVPGAYFGGDTIFRQGFKSVQVQGVEFYQLGEGGRIGHYPVHFHMVREVSPDTFVTDSSVWDSMTRWYVLHGAQGVTLQRDVGYKSIGHGYYLEDGTETNNTLDANVGIFARAAVQNIQNPRDIPGILAAPFPTIENVPCGPDTCSCGDDPNKKCPTPQEQVPYHSDVSHPTVFWIMNGWNKFEYNMADGAGTCGTCYWLLPGYISGPSRQEYWSGYSAEQRGLDRAAMAPLKEFYGNSCSSAMNSFNVVGDTTACLGVVNFVQNNKVNPDFPQLKPVPTDPKIVPPVIPYKPRTPVTESYYPNVDPGGGHFGTRCSGGACATVNKCSAGDRENCMVTVLDHYTSSFNWAESNFAAIWLRPQWNLVLQSAVTDVQDGGLTFVTGGDYTHSSAIPGVWELARKSVFVGATQPNDPYASEAGPFNPNTPLKCALQTNGDKAGSYCLSAADGISMPLTNFGVNQRLFSIYDGPAYEDSNAYLDITPTVFDCTRADDPNGNFGNCAFNSTKPRYMYEQLLGVPQDKNKACYLPNAGIGWKQPNGFYYPPAFHSQNLFFDNVPIRHYVIEPSFSPNTLFKTNVAEVSKRYCNFNNTMFNNFSDIDRQTELNDDDGSLTGLVNTISVNQDSFFDAPYSTSECGSDVPTAVPTDPTKTLVGTANTSPYDYVSTVLFPQCAAAGPVKPSCDPAFWSEDCANQTCFGVPLYRELATGTEKKSRSPVKGIRMMGESFYQRNTLTVNNGDYYMDTTVDRDKQLALGASHFSVFRAGQTYNVFFLFAKPSTTQTYSIYVGPGFNMNTDLKMIRAGIATKRIDITSKDYPDGWPAAWGTPTYQNGVLSVTVNMGFDNFKTDYNDERMADCQPNSFCKWSGDASTGTCGCNITNVDYPDSNLINECTGKNDAGLPSGPKPLPLCSWSVKDVVCPKGGCYGFSFRIPQNNEAVLPPAANCFPGPAATPTPSPWNTAFVPASGPLAGACQYVGAADPLPSPTPIPAPTPDFCP